MPNRTINFGASKEDRYTIARLATRAQLLEIKAGRMPTDTLVWIMDLTAAHNSCPLQLAALEAAADADFAHDVFGIARHIDRHTGELLDCFLPRYAQPEA